VTGLSALIRTCHYFCYSLLGSVISLVMCLVVQCIKVKINKLYIIFTHFFILYYIFPVSMIVLDGKFALDSGHRTDDP
jgi:hypothetical protein